ncbi:tRNA-queuosine alpha-mannosyltransferase domain-containing protein [Desulfogranum japonicum]|uniref:tRNA-queuosine alpha-mannosyltransferase domain-containing protein n=1 Tax=Desulfogranum japonicum TaxID=231447 RepID=UPI00048F06F0|nr:DUF3524 domain-containing protein [Desulfogranum japonicum]
MTHKAESILIIEPYYGGSHKSFLAGLQFVLDRPCTLLTLPAKKWKTRMHLAAPHMAGQIIDLYAGGKRYAGLFTSSFLDVAVLRSLLAQAGILLPIGLYFHENQFAYPSQRDAGAQYSYAAINFLSALCADAIAFNSKHNRDTFFQGVKGYLRKNKEFNLAQRVEQLYASSVILHPGMAFEPSHGSEKKCNRTPVIVWNHRWEHDKNPEQFFTALFSLAERQVPFHLIVLGQSFRNIPAIFDQAREVLGSRMLHFGFVSSRQQYLALLQQGSVVVSTARHEFFGYSVLEAVRAGCRPLVPDRLAYPELFPGEFRYGSGRFENELEHVLRRNIRLSQECSRALTEPYLWNNVAGEYRQWFQEWIASKQPVP